MCTIIHAQEQDTVLFSKSLDSVFITSYLNQATLQTLPPTQGTYLFKGKKSEVIKLSQTDANFADKTGRQVFAKVPGIFVYDMDGSGNQINISARGPGPTSWLGV